MACLSCCAIWSSASCQSSCRQRILDQKGRTTPNSVKHRAGESEIWPTDAPTKGLPQVLTRVLTRVCTRVPTKVGVLCVIIPYKGSHSSAHVSAHAGAHASEHEVFGRMSPGLFSPALFLIGDRDGGGSKALPNAKGGKWKLSAGKNP